MTERQKEQTMSDRIDAAARRIFRSGILDEIAEDADSGRLGSRDLVEDAMRIAEIVLEVKR